MRAKRLISLSFALATVVLLAGAVFTLMHWPYASALLLFGQTFGALCLIAWFAIGKQDKPMENGEKL